MWKYNLWSPIRLQSIKPSSLSLCLLQMLYVLYLFLLSCINDQISCFLLPNMTPFLLVHHHGSKMLRSESNSSITQSPIGWQISHFLTLLHEPDSGMCVCTSECVPLGVFYCSCVFVCVCVCERHPHEPPAPFTINRHSPPAGFHACSSLCASHRVL